MKKVLLVNGSPNAEGNTAQALSLMKEIFQREKLEILSFELGKQSIRGCTGCNGCERTHRCIFDDDKCNELIERMLEVPALSGCMSARSDLYLR